MLPQRAAAQTLRRLALQQPAYRFVAPAAITSSNALTAQRRCAATEALSEKEGNNQILAKQRLHRPVAPHLMIYRPQITWYLSALNRVTGVTLSGGLYVFGALYLVAPYLGWHLESAVIAASFAKLGGITQFGIKSLIAWPFTFHCFNGLRHLTWDFAAMINNKQVNQTGWAVVGLSAASAFALALI